MKKKEKKKLGQFLQIAVAAYSEMYKKMNILYAIYKSKSTNKEKIAKEISKLFKNKLSLEESLEIVQQYYKVLQNEKFLTIRGKLTPAGLVQAKKIQEEIALEMAIDLSKNIKKNDKQSRKN